MYFDAAVTQFLCCEHGWSDVEHGELSPQRFMDEVWSAVRNSDTTVNSLLAQDQWKLIATARRARVNCVSSAAGNAAAVMARPATVLM